MIAKRILVVADERPLRQSRVSLLEAENWVVESAGSDDDAMELLLTERFDLILLGRNSSLDSKGIDQRIREKYPNLLTLKIERRKDWGSEYASRVTDSAPSNVIAALHEMFDDDVEIVPIELPVRMDETASSL